MKKIISMILVLVFALACFVACDNADTNKPEDTTPATTEAVATEKDYTLALAVDSTVKTKVSNTVMALVLDADNKIVAARVDCVEATPALDDAGALVAQTSVATKVEKGDAYTGMAAGSWADQAKAFEAWLVGKSAADVAGTEFTKELIAGCTMTSSMATFKALVAEAFASANKVAFKTADPVAVGLALDTVVKSGRGGAVKILNNYVRKYFPEQYSEKTGENGIAIGTGAWLYTIDGLPAPGTGHSGPGTGAFTTKLFADYYDFT